MSLVRGAMSFICRAVHSPPQQQTNSMSVAAPIPRASHTRRLDVPGPWSSSTTRPDHRRRRPGRRPRGNGGGPGDPCGTPATTSGSGRASAGGVFGSGPGTRTNAVRHCGQTTTLPSTSAPKWAGELQRGQWAVGTRRLDEKRPVPSYPTTTAQTSGWPGSRQRVGSPDPFAPSPSRPADRGDLGHAPQPADEHRPPQTAATHAYPVAAQRHRVRVGDVVPVREHRARDLARDGLADPAHPHLRRQKIQIHDDRRRPVGPAGRGAARRTGDPGPRPGRPPPNQILVHVVQGKVSDPHVPPPESGWSGRVKRPARYQSLSNGRQKPSRNSGFLAAPRPARYTRRGHGLEPSMAEPGAITGWLDRLRAGDDVAAQRLWEEYFRRLVGMARARLQGRAAGPAGSEDIALSAFATFCRGAEAGRFPRLADRNDLWQVLMMLTARKTIDAVDRE